MTPTHPTHLEPSQLGTKEYWDAAYTTEIANHSSDPSDIGHSWFSESDAEGRVGRYLESLSDEGTLDLGETSFLDLGTGNGGMLFTLRDEGWRGEMLGVDYSAASVELARRVAGARGTDAEAEGVAERETGREEEIRFEVWDLLEAGYPESVWAKGGATGSQADESGRRPWDVVLDKGTFDAISLSGMVDAQGRRAVEGYRGRVLPLVKKTGLLVVTSCNWTSQELEKWFVHDESGDGFEVFGRVKYPSYKFGGQEGQTISTVCFRRIS